MKKTLTFIPLAIGISAAFIYLMNLIKFRIINAGITLQILSNLRIYLYISIIAFIFYFLIKILFVLSERKVITKVVEKEYEPLEIREKEVIKEVVLTGNKYCSNCGEKIFDTDIYCKNCGSYQKDKKSGISKFVKTLINVLQIILLIFILYFLVNTLLDYKEKTDPNFRSPLKINLTK